MVSTSSRDRVTVISGGTDGMGRALALARAGRGDRVVAIGSNAGKGRALLAAAAGLGVAHRVEFLPADLSSVAATRRLIGTIGERWPTVDALALFANRQAPKRIQTAEGLERTFALYYLSRYLLSHGLRERLDSSPAPVIVNVAGVGVTKGYVHWDDPQLTAGYGMVAAQLQAGRANDLLGVDFAARSGSRARYVLYHPGFTRSGDLGSLPVPVRAAVRIAARFAAKPVADAIAPIVDWIDSPPSVPLSAIDRGTPVPANAPTLDPGNARRLADLTEELLGRLDRV